MEFSKKDLGKMFRGVTHGSIQLKMGTKSCSPEKDILCNIIVNGQVQEEYMCCCFCKELLKKGSSYKACRNKHISKHYWKGELLGPLIIAQLVDGFNILHRRS